MRLAGATWRERLCLLPARSWLLLFFGFYGIAAVALLARHEWNPSIFVRFGAYYAEQNSQITPVGALSFVGDETNGGNGYDGQIFYYYSRTLFLPGQWPKGFNDAYRAPRVGLPLLGAPFALFGSWPVLVAMLFWQMALIAAGLLILRKMLHVSQRWLLVVYVFSPFTLQSAMVGVSDGVMIAWQLLGFYFLAGRAPLWRDDVAATKSLTVAATSGSEVAAGGTAESVDRFFQGRLRAFTAGLEFGSASWLDLLLAWVCLSMALLTKESALFGLFPLGLFVLLRLDWPRVLVVLATLVPLVAWQLYLREVHGMVPAGVLRVFLSPLDGVIGLGRETLALLAAFLSGPKLGGVLALAKHSAKLMLLALILSAFVGVFTGRIRRFFPFRAAVLFALASVLIADHYYFWSVYENISRMFTPLVPLVILLLAQDRRARPIGFVPVLLALALLVLVRFAFLTPVFPYEYHEHYQGPSLRLHAPVPGRSAPVP